MRCDNTKARPLRMACGRRSACDPTARPVSSQCSQKVSEFFDTPSDYTGLLHSGKEGSQLIKDGIGCRGIAGRERLDQIGFGSDWAVHLLVPHEFGPDCGPGSKQRQGWISRAVEVDKDHSLGGADDERHAL